MSVTKSGLGVKVLLVGIAGLYSIQLTAQNADCIDRTYVTSQNVVDSDYMQSTLSQYDTPAFRAFWLGDRLSEFDATLETARDWPIYDGLRNLAPGVPFNLVVPSSPTPVSVLDTSRNPILTGPAFPLDFSYTASINIPEQHVAEFSHSTVTNHLVYTLEWMSNWGCVSNKQQMYASSQGFLNQNICDEAMITLNARFSRAPQVSDTSAQFWSLAFDSLIFRTTHYPELKVNPVLPNGVAVTVTDSSGTVQGPFHIDLLDPVSSIEAMPVASGELTLSFHIDGHTPIVVAQEPDEITDVVPVMRDYLSIYHETDCQPTVLLTDQPLNPALTGVVVSYDADGSTRLTKDAIYFGERHRIRKGSKTFDANGVENGINWEYVSNPDHTGYKIPSNKPQKLSVQLEHIGIYSELAALVPDNPVQAIISPLGMHFVKAYESIGQAKMFDLSIYASPQIDGPELVRSNTFTLTYEDFDYPVGGDGITGFDLFEINVGNSLILQQYNIVEDKHYWQVSGANDGEHAFVLHTEFPECSGSIFDPLAEFSEECRNVFSEKSVLVATEHFANIQQLNDSLSWNAYRPIDHYQVFVESDGEWFLVYEGQDNEYILQEQARHRLVGCIGNSCEELDIWSPSDAGIASAPTPAPKPHIYDYGDDSIGTLEGNFRVNESGAATYSIPIMTAAGTAGVVPKVSLNYNSQSGIGIAGKGWSLSGGSAITRCRQVKQIDGKAKPITFTNEDRFCLDGQRLLVVSGSYGHADSVYRTETDTYVEVTAKGGNNTDGSPDYFIVKKKDGSTSYYGNTADSRQTVGSNIHLTWGINQFEDSFGNPIKFSYIGGGDASTSSGFVLDRIDYAFGTDASITHSDTFIDFNYDTGVPQQGYINGYLVASSKKLLSIEVFAEHNGSSVQLREYKLDYERVENEDQLNSVQECVSQNNCKIPTEFEWANTHSAGSGQGLSGSELPMFDSADDNLVGTKLLDVNGDGLQDIAWIRWGYHDGGGHQKDWRLHYVLATESGYAHHDHFRGSAFHPETTPGNGYHDGEGYCYHEGETYCYGWGFYGEDSNAAETMRLETIDYNADGREDLMVNIYWMNNGDTHGRILFLSTPYFNSETGETEWRLKREHKLPFSGSWEQQKDIQFADLNADGLTDAWMYAPNGDFRTYFLQPNPSAAKTSNMYYAHVEQPYQSIPPPAASDTYINYESQAEYLAIAPPAAVPTYSRYTAEPIGSFDLDGDGQMEMAVLFRRAITWQKAIGPKGIYLIDQVGILKKNDSGTYQLLDDVHTLPPYAQNTQPDILGSWMDREHSVGHVARFVDINGDSLADKLVQEAGVWNLYLNKGDGSFESTPIQVGSHDKKTLGIASFNHDKYPDIYWKESGAIRARLWDPFVNNFAAPFVVQTANMAENVSYQFVNLDREPGLEAISVDTTWAHIRMYDFATHPDGHANIKTIENGLGATTSITYKTMVEPGDHYHRIEGIGNGQPMSRSWCHLFAQCGTFEYTTADTSEFYQRLNDPFGALTDVTIHPEMSAPILELYEPISLVTKIENTAPAYNPAWDAVNESATASIMFEYYEAKSQAGGRGFLGFRKLATIDAQTGVKTTTEFRQDFPFIGMPVKTTREVMTDSAGHGGGLLSESVNSYGVKSFTCGNYDGSGWFDSGVEQCTTIDPIANGCKELGPLQPYLAEVTEKSYSTQSVAGSDLIVGTGVLQATITSNTYDDAGAFDKHGNIYEITSKVFQGDIDVSETNLLKTTVTTNSYSPASWTTDDPLRYGRLSRTKVQHIRTALAGGVAGSETRVSAFDYYPMVDGGLLKEEIIEPDLSEFRLKTAYFYDAFGNKERIVQTADNGRSAAGAITPFGASAVPATRETEWQHEAGLGRYLEVTTNDKDQIVETVLARNAYGAPTKVKNMDGVISETDYTPFGRPYLSWNEAGSYTATRYINCSTSVCPSGAVGAVYGVLSEQAGGGESIEYFDRLARPIQTRALHFDGTRYVIADSQYDVFGRVARRSEPYFEGGTKYWTTSTYDLLGMPSEIVRPHPSASVPPKTLIDYDGLRVTTRQEAFISAVTLAAGQHGGAEQHSTQLKNVLGEVVEVEDNLSGKVTYLYEAQGNLKKTITHAGTHADAGGIALGDVASSIAIDLSYDKLGRKISMNDPDKGEWFYGYNGFGELIDQEDANGNITLMAYDSLGRMVHREDCKDPDADPSTMDCRDAAANDPIYYATLLDGDTVWLFDGDGPGRLDQVDDSVSGYTEDYEYDALGRQHEVTTQVAGQGSFTQRSTFDEYGRAFQRFDGSDTTATHRQGVAGWQYRYNESGYLEQIHDAQSVDGVHKTYSTVTKMTVRGQAKEVVWGNGAISERSYEPERGIPTGIVTTLGMYKIQDLELEFDDFNNLMRKHNKGLGIGVNSDNSADYKNLDETYVYDGLNRLRAVSLGGVQTQAMDYDTYGNIKSKTGVGDYQYGQVVASGGANPMACGYDAGPHAVTSIDNDGDGSVDEVYCYDRNGNVIADTSPDGARAFIYSSFDKPIHITKGNHTSQFSYGPSRGRFLRVDTNTANSSLEKTTLYIGSFEKITHEDDRIEYKRMIDGGILITDSFDDASDTTADTKIQFVIKDHLGSTELVLVDDNLSNPVEADLSFDAWGQRRESIDYSVLSLNDTIALRLGQVEQTTNRGFTGHEMLDEVGVIHMNGRIYDPRLGRFLQADPIIQAAAAAQSYNRYTYVMNNPFMGTDPSGYSWRRTVGGILGFLSCFCAQGAAIGASIGAGFDTYYAGGSGSDIFRSAVTAAAFTYISFSVPGLDSIGWNLDTLGTLVTVGTIGGVESVINGGKFGYAFVSAGIGTLIGIHYDGNVIAKAIGAAVVGGTVSDLTGGKFANGAATAAFASLVSSGAEAAYESYASGHGGSDHTPKRAEAEADIRKLQEDGVLTTDMRFSTKDELAKHWAEHTYEITDERHIELGAALVKHVDGGKVTWSIGEIQFGKICSNGLHCVKIGPGEYTIHNHPSRNAMPSTGPDGDVSQVKTMQEIATRPRKGIYTVGSKTDIRYCGINCASGLREPRVVE